LLLLLLMGLLAPSHRGPQARRRTDRGHRDLGGRETARRGRVEGRRVLGRCAWELARVARLGGTRRA